MVDRSPPHAHSTDSGIGLKFVEEVFRVSLRNGMNWARAMSHGRQEMAKSSLQKVTNRKVPTAPEKIDPIAECRDGPKAAVREHLFLGDVTEGTPARQISYTSLYAGRQRAPPCAEGASGQLFAGSAHLSCSDVSQMSDDTVACHAVGDKTKKGVTKQGVCMVPPENMTMTPTKSQGWNSMLKFNPKK